MTAHVQAEASAGAINAATLSNMETHQTTSSATNAAESEAATPTVDKV